MATGLSITMSLSKPCVVSSMAIDLTLSNKHGEALIVKIWIKSTSEISLLSMIPMVTHQFKMVATLPKKLSTTFNRLLLQIIAMRVVSGAPLKNLLSTIPTGLHWSNLTPISLLCWTKLGTFRQEQQSNLLHNQGQNLLSTWDQRTKAVPNTSQELKTMTTLFCHRKLHLLPTTVAGRVKFVSQLLTRLPGKTIHIKKLLDKALPILYCTTTMTNT